VALRGSGCVRARAFIGRSPYLRVKITRSEMLIARTRSVMSAAPPHASRCQVFVRASSRTGRSRPARFAIGRFMSADQNWLLSAVKSSGAVSPRDARDREEHSPSTMPARAAR